MTSPPPNVYDVGQTVTLSCLFLVGSTIGQISKGQNTLYVQDASGFTQGQPIFVEDAGYVGGDLFSTITAITGQLLTLADVAGSDAQRVTVGQLANPVTVTAKVSQPDGSEVVLAPILNPTTGKFTASFTIAQSGSHFYRFTGTGAAAGDAWGQFDVRPERVP